MPSIMRAPPDAATISSGCRVSCARSTARAIVSPTTAPILPPIKLYSITLSTYAMLSQQPQRIHNGVVRPVSAWGLGKPALVGLRSVKSRGSVDFDSRSTSVIAWFEQHLHALSCSHPEVVAALGHRP